MKDIRIVSYLLILALFSGCDQRKGEEGIGIAPVAETTSHLKEASDTTRSSEVRVPASILPHEPSVRDDLRVVVPGGGEIRKVSWYRNGTLVPGADLDVLPSHSFLKGEEVSVEVTTDLGSGSAAKLIGNAPPEVITANFLDPRIHAGKPIEILPQGVDDDGDALEFRCIWAVNGEILAAEASPVLPPDYFRKGDRILVEVFASDGENEGPPFVGQEFVIPNAPPVFVTEPLREFSGRHYVYESRAEDPDGDPLVYSLETAPAGMSMDAGVISWPIGSSAAGEHQIRIVAADEDAAIAVQDYLLRISPGGSGE